MAATTPQASTPEEYLGRERKAAHKSEYWHGLVYTMAGDSANHDTICVNLVANLHRRLAFGKCRLHTSDMKVGVTKRRGFAYPDLTITCGQRKYYDAVEDVLNNPTVIFEVLSDSTREFDQTTKWDEYQKLESLRHYVLIEQESRWVRHYERLENRRWTFEVLSAPDASLKLAATAIDLPLDEIYAEITFPAAEPDESGWAGSTDPQSL